MTLIDPEAIKRDNEAIILQHGGEICNWLPSLSVDPSPRNIRDVARRALVLNAMLQIAFNAPIPVIRQWISDHGLEGDVVASERAILAKEDEDLTEQEETNLAWYIEALWALTWAGGLIDQLPFNQPVGSNLASLCPNLQQGDDGSKLLNQMRLRQHAELFRMLDLYYRVHWWTRNAQLCGQLTGDVSIDVIMERRKALGWLLNREADWDNVEMST